MVKRIKVKCPLCDKEFDNVHSLFGHLISTHCDEAGYFISPEGKGEEKTIYECRFCGYTTESYEDMVNHLLNCHYAELQKEAEKLREAGEKKSKRGKAKKKSAQEETPKPSP